MRYLSVGLFHPNKFPVKFVGPSLFFPWLLVFYHLTDAFVLGLFQGIYIKFTSSMLLFLNASSFTSPLPHFHYFLALLLLFSFEETLLSLYSYYNIINIIIAESFIRIDATATTYCFAISMTVIRISASMDVMLKQKKTYE